MDSLVKDALADFVKEHGFKRYPQEACGLVYADASGKPHFVECKNVSLEPEHNFLIDPKEYLEVEKLGEVVACWHTHCDIPPRASNADKQGCKNTQVPWFIGSVFGPDLPYRFEGLTLVEVDEGFEMPLIGRTYSFGVFDCFSLMRDFYKQEMDTELPDIPRTERVWTSEPNYMEKRAEDVFGFVRLPEGSHAIKGDLFFIQTGREGADHIGIYLGDDRILHQMRSRLSRVDIYGGSYWHEHTLSHWRHKSKC
jgi:proteasome lid subunit RPN8/RPN11